MSQLTRQFTSQCTQQLTPQLTLLESASKDDKNTNALALNCKEIERRDTIFEAFCGFVFHFSALAIFILKCILCFGVMDDFLVWGKGQKVMLAFSTKMKMTFIFRANGCRRQEDDNVGDDLFENEVERREVATQHGTHRTH